MIDILISLIFFFSPSVMQPTVPDYISAANTSLILYLINLDINTFSCSCSSSPFDNTLICAATAGATAAAEAC